MPVRTTNALVEAILVDFREEVPLAPFIEAANHVVNRVVAVAPKGEGFYYDEIGSAEDATALEIIERWLSAHFYAAGPDARTQFEGVGPLMTRFQTRVDLNLSLTHYGQQAMVLDTSGALAAWNRTLEKGGIVGKARLTWLGNDPTTTEDDS